jgi:hypothetical protein
MLPSPTADDREAWSRVDATGVVSRAVADLGTPWPQPLASQASRVYRDGDRIGWETPAFARQHRLSRATIAAVTTLDEVWIDEVVDGVHLLCEQSSWCWPAHDNPLERHGSVLAVVSDPTLDLGAGEVVSQLAWIDHLLGTQLDERAPGLRDRIRHEAEARVFQPFVLRRDWHWLGLDGDVHNWNPWIHSAVLTAALQLHDDPDQIIDLVVEGLALYLDSLPDDGAIDEGYSYWWNGACRALEAVDLLEHTAGRAVTEIPGLRETIAFPHRCHLGGGWYANLADGQARLGDRQPWQALHRAARRSGDSDAAAHAAAHRSLAPSETSGLGRLVRELTDAEWVTATPGAPPLPRDVWFPSTQVMLARQRGGSAEGLGLVVKGGHNAEHHNHNDVGSFIVTSDGVPVIVDPGRPTYTKTTFGPDRYSIWTMQSSWHNTPRIAGVEQSAGRQFAASHVEISTTDAASTLTLDLQDAYEVPLQQWRRSATLDRENGAVRVADAWSGVPSGRPTTLTLVIAGSVSPVNTAGRTTWGVRVTPLDGATAVSIQWPAGVDAVCTERTLDDPMLSEVWGERLTRIELDVSSRADAWITVEKDDATSASGSSEDNR